MSMEKFYFFITIFLCDDRKLFALFWYFNFVISFIEKSKFNIYIYTHISLNIFQYFDKFVIFYM